MSLSCSCLQYGIPLPGKDVFAGELAPGDPLECSRVPVRQSSLGDEDMCCCKPLVPSMTLDTVPGLHNQYRIETKQVRIIIELEIV
jgi:hypothetical protein